MKTSLDLIKNLSIERKKIQDFQPEKALDYILNHKDNVALIHSFPEEDFYFLIKEIGIEDSLPLLSLASYKQWDYIIDTFVWKKSQIDIYNITHLFYILLKADPDRFINWFLKEENIEFVELYIFRNVEVKIREHDQDPSDFSDDFQTIDDVFYYRLKDVSIDVSESNIIKEERDEFLTHFLKKLSSYDHSKYHNVLLESDSIIPSEIEEKCYRFRNVRLSEKGFLPFEEAIGVYQPLKVEDIIKMGKKILLKRNKEDFLPVPLYPIFSLDKENNLFVNILKKLANNEYINDIQIEFANLSNQIVVADQFKVENRDDLKKIVAKSSGFINIALEFLSFNSSSEKLEDVVLNYPLLNLFRVGYGIILELKNKCLSWKNKSFFYNNNLSLSFWGEHWVGVLGGLFLKRPLFFDNYKRGVLYREFLSMFDIQNTESILNEIIAFDELLSKINIVPKNIPNKLLTYKNFILTLWARYELNLSHEFIPIPLDNFRKLSLYNRNADFLNWLSKITDISQKTDNVVKNLFNEIETEYGKVSKDNLDSRFIELFWIK
ncbi:MAG: hypothetical protein HQK79_19390 [Desulfobacterales bacterium]|nr:hypothetical protein [Desulfobacterales bacterium]MBF0396939.1 hypothetical protein [Desulfobacterales bacterium]